ncbi:MAG TPA: alpha/beta fold hydrolase [Solirubrobacteraceae bacterium]
MLPFDEIGSGPAVVLLHAGIADRTMWREQLAPLADAGYRVLALDMPGFGEAPIWEGPQAPWEDVMATLAQLEIERAALVGNSFGGAVALRIALLAPALVSSLVLISAPSPGMADPSPRLAAVWAAETTALEHDDIDGAVEAIVEGWTLPNAPAALREHVAQMQRRALILQTAVPNVSEARDPLEEQPQELAKITAPTLVAVGEHDMVDFLAAADVMAEVIPDARHELIAGAGHLAPLETPAALRRLLLDFLAEHP